MTSKRPISTTSVTPFGDGDYKLDLQNLAIGELLGKGNFSKVYKGLYLGNIVAVKKCEISDPALLKYIMDELSILRRVHHPGVIGYIGALKPPKKADKEFIYIVTDYVPGGDLRMLLQRKGMKLGWKLRTRLLAETAEALLYLHDRGILHRDVKTDNIMLSLDLKPVLIDLGFARVMPKENKNMTMCGTDEFMSPEVLFGMEYDEASDIFSFGVVMAEVVTKKEPGKATKFLNRTPRAGFCIEMEELDKEYKKVKAPAALLDLTKQAVADEVEDRPTTEQLVESLHSILKELPDDSKDVRNMKEEDILLEINKKWERILKKGDKENSNLALDEDDFTKNFLYSKTLEKKPEEKGREQSLAERRRSVQRGVRETKEHQAALSGYLWKKGGNFKSWKKRYMTLTSEGLIYFKTKDDLDKNADNPQGALLFMDMIMPDGHPAAELVSLVVSGRRYCFRVLTKSKKRFIAAQSDAEAKAWVDSINQGLAGWRNRMRSMN